MSCSCVTVCACVTDCAKVCSSVCESVGSCSGHWTTSGTQRMTTTFWSSLKAAVDGWRSNFFLSASPAGPSANARILASDFNTKIRDPLNANTQTWASPNLTTVSLGVATAVAGTSIATSGTRSVDVLGKINSRRCSTVLASKTYTYNPATTCSFCADCI